MGSVQTDHESKSCSPPIPIAIIGMACRTPGGVSSPEDLWQLCVHGRSGWSEIPASRFNSKVFYHPNADKAGCFHSTGGNLLQHDISRFDNSFFRISDSEAQAMDPQQRLLLECTYEAIENASIDLYALAGKDVGVFASGTFSEYGVLMSRDPETMPSYKATGCADSLLSNRISYMFDLRGPSMTIDTACSSSLTAMHVACQSMRAGETKMAIVAGCHLNLSPDDFIAYSSLGLLSADGKSRAFDHRASGGFGRGEGVGCVILKPLNEAIQDGDKIRAVMMNSGINQDGKTAGITRPSTEAQEALARRVYRSASLDPLDTDYVECHGTGTAIGDPIEVAAVGQVFGRPADSRRPLYIGSIKSNIGHLEGASGIVSIIKAALMLEKGFLLPNCDFEKPNPAIPLDKFNLKILTRLRPWQSQRRRASINNFGFGGANAHFILEQAPKPSSFLPTDGLVHAGRLNFQEKLVDLITPETRLGKSRRLIVISASNEDSTRLHAKRLAQYLTSRPDFMSVNGFSNLVLTLQRRTLFPWRIAISASSQTEAMEKLKEEMLPERSNHEPRIGFVFTGQGAQWYAMGRELVRTYPIYAESLLYAESILKLHGCEWSLLEELSRDEESSRVGEAYIAQPSCTAVQLALVDLLRSWDIRPISVVGHSSGEIAAAYTCGAITFETAISLAYFRGKAATELRRVHPSIEGAMLALGGQLEDINSFLDAHRDQRAVKACINSPKSVTMSGDVSDINRLDEAAKGSGLFSRKLRTGVAYHSSHMTLIAGYYRDCIGKFTPKEPGNVEFHSSVIGSLAGNSSLGPDYWVTNLTSPVLFSDALGSLLKEPGKSPEILIEIGPHSALKGPIRESLNGNLKSSAKVEYLSSLLRTEDAVAALLQTAEKLVTKGARLNLPALNFPTKDARQQTILTDLDTYAWDHSKSHWYESRTAQGHRFRNGVRNDILGVLTADNNDIEPQWRNIIKLEDVPWLEHHQIHGNTVFPMSGFVSMAIEAMKSRAESRGLTVDRYVLRDVYTSKALHLSSDDALETKLSLRPYNESATTSSDKWQEFRIFACSADGDWTEHCRGLVASESESTNQNKSDVSGQIAERCTTTIDPTALYDMYRVMGFDIGPLFTGMKSLKVGPGLSTGTFEIPDSAAMMPFRYESSYVIHPVTLDRCFQFFIPAVTGLNLNFRALWVPESIERITISARTKKDRGTELQVFGRQRCPEPSSRKLTGSIFMDDLQENETSFALEIQNYCMVKVSDEHEWQRESKLAYKLDWKPDIAYVSTTQMYGLRPLPRPTHEVMQESLILENASLVFLQRALSQVVKEQIPPMQSHLQKLYVWMQHVCRLRRDTSVLLSSHTPSWTDSECVELAAQVCGPRGVFICLLGENLPAILRGEVESHSLVLQGDLLRDYYATQDFLIRSYHWACHCVDLIAHRNPAIKILEVGAGTGGATLPTLKTLGGNGGKPARFLRYDVSDISSDCFDGLKELTKPWSSLLRFRVLDIEKDVVEQGFAEGEYDLVVAANVLHATSDLTNTLSNVRKLLKPGATLILVEETVPALGRFPFATLPGWWLSQEKYRSNGPLISEPQWDALLRENGFSGLDLCLQDYPGEPAHTNSVMISFVQEAEHQQDHHSLVLISNCDLMSTAMNDFKASIQPGFSHPLTVVTPGEALTLNLETAIIVFIDSVDAPMLASVDDEKLKQIKSYCQAQGLIWVTPGAASPTSDPSLHFVSGLARSLRSEIAGLKFAVLHHKGDVAGLAKSIGQIHRKVFLSNTMSSDIDFEFMECDGVLHIPRAFESPEVESVVTKYGSKLVPESQPFIQPGRSFALQHEASGILSGFHFEDKETPHHLSSQSNIRIDIKAMGINFKDVVVALGQVEGHIGSDCSGIVTAVGAGVKHLAVGDRVCALGRETFSTWIECRQVTR